MNKREVGTEKGSKCVCTHTREEAAELQRKQSWEWAAFEMDPPVLVGLLGWCGSGQTCASLPSPALIGGRLLNK